MHSSIRASIALALLALTAAGQNHTTSVVSVDSSVPPIQGDRESWWQSLSLDGRFVAFASYSSNLDPLDGNHHFDVFWRELQTGTTSLVSLRTDGLSSGNNNSWRPSMSGDGQMVAFASFATNLVAGDDEGEQDVFVRDMSAQTTYRVSVQADGTTGGNGRSWNPSISPDGRFVAFSSEADDLVAGDDNGLEDVFVRDLVGQVTFRVSVSLAGDPEDGGSYEPSISADGLFVAFWSEASNLVADDNNALGDVFVRDVAAGTTTRVSLDTLGLDPNGRSDRPSISTDGRIVGFRSAASNLVEGDWNIVPDIFAHDRQNGETVMVSVNRNGDPGSWESCHVSVSENGRYLAFGSHADNLADNLDGGDTNGRCDVFLHDRHHRRTKIVSLRSDGTQPINGPSGDAAAPDLAYDGRMIVYDSAANLVLPDTNGTWKDVFLYQGTVSPIVIDVVVYSAAFAAPVGDGPSSWPSVSQAGDQVAFVSAATDLIANDLNGVMDVFVRDGETGITERISVDSTGKEADGDSFEAAISADGRWVAFTSAATDLVSGDTNADRDVFLHDRDTGSTTRVSLSSGGSQANGDSHVGRTISSGGRYVPFHSEAKLVYPDLNKAFDVFVRDTATGTTIRASESSGGAPGDAHSDCASISADGRYVAFQSAAANLVSGDSNGAIDVFVHDLQTHQTSRVSVDSTGKQGNADSGSALISATGRWVAFASLADNLVDGDGNSTWDAFVHDRQTGLTERVSLSSMAEEGNSTSGYPAIAPDGRYVAFWSLADNLVPMDENGAGDIFLRDRITGETTCLSTDSRGVLGNLDSYEPMLSLAGRAVAFTSLADNLVDGDVNQVSDVFVRTTRDTLGMVEIYCTAKQSSQGCVPQIASQGACSLSDPEPFDITATGVINNKNGIFFYGYQGRAAIPFQGGWLCVQPPILRTAVQPSGGNPPPNDCSGAFRFDFNAALQAGGAGSEVIGTRVNGQYWYRDPQDPSTTGLTDAIEFQVLP